ncbi:MAG TPA: mandelate racemase/muconate lactonizing enzyme family protein, partial [Acidimicrobiales bacterium]|nr:mandelate racemase/muconate lactonizing enzyme family protein [Acidimicrobiales bacterium]
SIPLEAPYLWAGGIYPGFSKTIVEVESADGVVGIGEAANAEYAALITEQLTPRLIGANPYDLADCERRCVPPYFKSKNTEDGGVIRAYGGLEMAIWDLVGKLEGRSVASLLGGLVRQQVPFSEYFAMRLERGGAGGERTPKDVAEYCARVLERHGARMLEGKIGTASITEDVAMVREIRSAVGFEIPLRLDANMAWSVLEARQALHLLEPFNVLCLEEPVRTLDELALLRQGTAIAFSSHDPDLAAAVRLGVPDAFVVNLSVLGGIRRTVQFIGACQELGVDVWFYSPDTGVANAAYLQVAGALEWVSKPSQTLLRWHADDVLDGGPMIPDQGSIRVPDGPGFGVSIDPVALERCHRRYLDEGRVDFFARAMPTH